MVKKGRKLEVLTMYIKCAKCGEIVRPYSEGLSAQCNCKKKPIMLSVEGGEIKISGPNKKIVEMEEVDLTPKVYLVDVYITTKNILAVSAIHEDEAAAKVQALIDIDEIDPGMGLVCSSNIVSIVKTDYKPTLEGDSEDEDEEW